MTLMASAKGNKRNDSSPQGCQDIAAASHSTPVRKRNGTSNAEESPGLEYCPSPILLTYTQESGNEVAWDWHSSISKTPDSRCKGQSAQCETPKRAKLLQRKRNSNSPLLYKPLKRKSIKMESIENIGQFAAELQALNERMRIIKEMDKGYGNGDTKGNTASVVETCDSSEVRGIQVSQQDCGVNIDSRDGADAKIVSYDDLFDDSIDDSMARCTQEIEERFSMIPDRGTSTSSRKTEALSVGKATGPTAMMQTGPASSPMQFSTSAAFHSGPGSNSKLKTYSKPLKRDWSSGVHAATWRDESLHKLCLNNNNNNNNMIHSRIDRASDKRTSRSISKELFDIPDDSFDDCLATCMEDEKLLSVSTRSNDSSERKDNGARPEAGCRKRSIDVALSEKGSCDSVAAKAKSRNSCKPAAKFDTSAGNSLENRKFFKTKSLSDQYIGQDTTAQPKATTTSASSVLCQKTKLTLHPNAPAKNSTTTTTHANATHLTAATNTFVANDGKFVDGASRTDGSDVSRCATQRKGNDLVKYNSSDSLRSDAKARAASQPVQCTAEEIEKKRLQAKMRLEARRKMHRMKIMNDINR